MTVVVLKTLCYSFKIFLKGIKIAYSVGVKNTSIAFECQETVFTILWRGCFIISLVDYCWQNEIIPLL